LKKRQRKVRESKDGGGRGPKGDHKKTGKGVIGETVI